MNLNENKLNKDVFTCKSFDGNTDITYQNYNLDYIDIYNLIEEVAQLIRYYNYCEYLKDDLINYVLIKETTTIEFPDSLNDCITYVNLLLDKGVTNTNILIYYNDEYVSIINSINNRIEFLKMQDMNCKNLSLTINSKIDDILENVNVFMEMMIDKFKDFDVKDVDKLKDMLQSKDFINSIDNLQNISGVLTRKIQPKNNKK